MGVKKARKSSAKGGGVKKVARAIADKYYNSGNKTKRPGKSRMTPERLSKKILVEKLKKRLYQIKYGGRR